MSDIKKEKTPVTQVKQSPKNDVKDPLNVK